MASHQHAAVMCMRIVVLISTTYICTIIINYLPASLESLDCSQREARHNGDGGTEVLVLLTILQTIMCIVHTLIFEHSVNTYILVCTHVHAIIYTYIIIHFECA